MADMRIGLIGAGGRMGQAIIRQIALTEGCRIAAACDTPGSGAVGRDAGAVAGIDPAGVEISDSAEAVFADADAVIEFTLPEPTARHAALAAESGIPHIIGTTGLDAAQSRILRQAGEKTVVMHAPNMSLAVNLLFALTRQVAGALDDAFDIEIVEMHHRHKVDAPSGTAVGLGEAAAAGRGVGLEDAAAWTRHGQTGERRRGDIGFAVLRGGNVVGEHTVVFAAEDERLELTHKAQSRQIFARGAVHAALWSKDQSPGYYTMLDVLGID